MNQFRLGLLVLSLVALAACGGNRSCKKEQFYENARLGEPVVVPDDLDELQQGKELKIPQPSGRPPRPADAGCVDKPPPIPASNS